MMTKLDERGICARTDKMTELVAALERERMELLNIAAERKNIKVFLSSMFWPMVLLGNDYTSEMLKNTADGYDLFKKLINVEVSIN